MFERPPLADTICCKFYTSDPMSLGDGEEFSSNRFVSRLSHNQGMEANPELTKEDGVQLRNL